MEEVEEWRLRQLAGGMRSMRLPDHYEVVDAELAAMLMVLRETAQEAGAGEKRCLIMSDCEAALGMAEEAWRKERREYGGKGRGAILEAICTYREQLGGVVMMYAPAHRGGWANAAADAAAKAGLTSDRGDISGMIEQGIEWRPTVTGGVVDKTTGV